jgi:hypothetical protein
MMLAAALALAVGGMSARAAGTAVDEVTLTLTPSVATYSTPVSFAGTVTPPQAIPVEIVRRSGAQWIRVLETDALADGAFSVRMTARVPGTYAARAGGVRSPGRTLSIRPRVGLHFDGLPVLGATLWLTGRVTPAVAGSVTVRFGTRAARWLAPDELGRFRTRVPTRRAGTVTATVRVVPRAGYVSVRRVVSVAVRTPLLSLGSRRPAVRFLESRLRELRYALVTVNSTFQRDTRDAVYAFQEIERIAVDGVVGRQTWTALLTARTPWAAVPRGRYVQVDKSRQVLFEVRRGGVVKIAHISSGVTGNTPVGVFRVYRKTPGYNAVGMYYSLYFLRGFAIHGYSSVPPYPASHGCVRTPLWFARGFYSRWPVGTVVRVA